jgi:spore coat protein U-like protein
MRSISKLISVAGLAGCLAAPGLACAATATGTLTVTATVTTACSIVTLPLAFGNYDPTSATDLNGSTTATLTCTPGTAYKIGMDAGQGSGATVTTRKMTSGSNTLNYKLYRDSARTLNWGNTPGTDTLDGTSSLLTTVNTINIYGTIPKSQAAGAGAYTDTVTVTVTY